MEPGIGILFDMRKELLNKERLSGRIHDILLSVFGEGRSHRGVLGKEGSYSRTGVRGVTGGVRT